MNDDFEHTVARLRQITAGAPASAAEVDDVANAVAFLYEHLTAHNQLVRAVRLLTDVAPMLVQRHPRLSALYQHALQATARLGSVEHELVKAREGVYSMADDWIAGANEMPWRVAYWLRAVRLSRAERAMEYGCGHGAYVMCCARLEQAVEWTGIDISFEQIKLNRAQAKRLRVPAAFLCHPDIASPSIAADSVAVLHVLEHTAYPAETLTEAERHVRPGGHVVVVVPEDAGAAVVSQEDLDSIRAGHGTERGHINSMSLADLLEIVKSRGRLLDAARVPTAPGNWDACVTYAPMEQ